MKIYVSAFLLIFAMSLTGYAQELTKISGTITNPTSDILTFSYATDVLGKERVNQKATLDDQGTFSLEFNMEKGAYTRFSHGAERSSIYLEPGAELTMSLNTEEFDESLAFEGEGAAPSEYLLDYFLTFEDGEARENYYDLLRNASPAEFIAFEKERMTAKKAFLKEHNADLPEALVKDQMTTFTYDYGDEMLYFGMYYGHRIDQSQQSEEAEELPALPGDYYDFLAEVPINVDEAIGNEMYRKYLDSYVNYKHQELIAEQDEENYDQARWGKDGMALISMLFTGTSQDIMIANRISAYLRDGDAATVKTYYEAFTADKAETYPNIAKSLTEGYETAKKLMPGQPAPNLTLMNLDGKEVSLSDFKGKVVYIDFWASWCGPCIREVPYAKELKENMKDEKDLVFLYISIDDTEKPWKKAVDTHGLKGVHVISKTWQGEAPTTYSVRGIPRYYLINRDGTIANNNAPRPSSGDVLINEMKAALTGKPVQGGGSK